MPYIASDSTVVYPWHLLKQNNIIILKRNRCFTFIHLPIFEMQHVAYTWIRMHKLSTLVHVDNPTELSN